MPEIWKPITGFESIYDISSHGRVRSLDRMIPTRWGTPRFVPSRLRKARVGETGYLYLILYKEGHNQTHKIHRLVASAFCDKRPGCDVVNHLDGNRLNNRADNLEWTTISGNTLHALQNGFQTPLRGQANGAASLLDADIDHIRLALINGESHEEVAKRFGTSSDVITGIKSGRKWRYIGNPSLRDACAATPKNMQNHPRTKLNDALAREIILELSSGKSVSQIARERKISRSTISFINRGVYYADVGKRLGLDFPYLRNKSVLSALSR